EAGNDGASHLQTPMTSAVASGAPTKFESSPWLGVARIAIGALILARTTPILAPFHILFLGDASPMLGWPEPGFSFAWLSPGAIGALCLVRTVGAAALTLGLWT